MKIEQTKFVSMNYTLSLDSGVEVEKSDPEAPLGFVHGFGMLIPGLERQIEGMEAGESKQVVVEAEEGYGVPVPELIRTIPREQFQVDMPLEAGQTYASQTDHGVIRFTVKSVDDETVTIDLNHPLAGEKLHFLVDVTEVREATEAELEAAQGSCAGGDCGGCSCGCE